MLSYASGATSPPLLDETIGDNLARTTATFPDREALVECATGRRWTYGEFYEATRRIATALIERGTKPGDRIGMWSPNTAEWPMIQYATAQVGAILVNINPAYRADELEYVLNQSSMCTVFAAPEFKSSDYASMLDNVRGRCPALSDVIIIGWEPWQQIADTPADTDALSRVQSGMSPSDPINIQYTSGTTGFPKGATLTHTNILNNGYLVGEGLEYTEQDRVCIPVPYYHCFGMVLGNLACTTHGATMVIPAPGFEPEATLKAVAAERCTSLYGVPTMFIGELELPNFDSFDLSTLADRDHGRIDVPRAGDAQRHRPHAHERCGDRLRHDRDVAHVDPDAADRQPDPAGDDGGPGGSAHRGPGHRPGDRCTGRARYTG